MSSKMKRGSLTWLSNTIWVTVEERVGNASSVEMVALGLGWGRFGCWANAPMSSHHFTLIALAWTMNGPIVRKWTWKRNIAKRRHVWLWHFRYMSYPQEWCNEGKSRKDKWIHSWVWWVWEDLWINSEGWLYFAWSVCLPRPCYWKRMSNT